MSLHSSSSKLNGSSRPPSVVRSISLAPREVERIQTSWAESPGAANAPKNESALSAFAQRLRGSFSNTKVPTSLRVTSSRFPTGPSTKLSPY